MPSGAAHRKLAWATSPLLILGAWTMGGFPSDLEAWVTIGVVTAAYLANPVLLSPDTDLPESAPSNRWGIFEPILWPLQMIIHKGNYRNPLSHWPPLSSITRMFFIWAMTFLLFLSGIFLTNLIWVGLFKQVLVPFAVGKWFGWWCVVIASPWWWKALWGITIADVVHTASDIIWSYMRK